MKPKLMFVVNTDKFFMSHRLPIALAAIQKGFEVHVAAGLTNCTDRMRSLGLIIHPLTLDRSSRGILSNGYAFFQVLSLFMQVRPDVVHLVTIKPVLLGGLAARLTKVRCVVVAISGLGFVFVSKGLKADLRLWLVSGLYRLILGCRNQKVIFQNEDDREVLIRRSGLLREKTVLVKGSGVDLDEYSASPLPEGTPVVMLAARMLIDKGVREFVGAARRLRDLGISARFVLVGIPDIGNPNTITEEELNQWVAENVVEWWGHRSDMPGVLAKCNIFVLPSFYGEGLPKVLIEAAACSRPVITTDHPGCRDAIVPNKTGFLIPTHNTERLGEIIKTMLLDRSLCEEMGRAGRELAEQVFDVKQVVKQHLHIYDELLQKTS